MKKANNKGFMMAEVVVVSAIVLVVLGTLYVSFNKLYSVFQKRASFYDTVALYRLRYYRDLLVESNIMNQTVKNTVDVTNIYVPGANNNILNPQIISSAGTKDMVFLLHTNGAEISYDKIQPIDSQGYMIDLNKTFIDYMNFLSTAAVIESNYVMIIESCPEKVTTKKDLCKYAYLPIYDGCEGKWNPPAGCHLSSNN